MLVMLVDGAMSMKMQSTDKRTCTESQSAVERAVLIYSPRVLTMGWFVSLCVPMSSRHQTAEATPLSE